MPVESLIEQSQFERSFYGHEDNVHLESDLTGATLYKSTDTCPWQCKTFIWTCQPAIFESMADQPHQWSFPKMNN